MAEQAVSKSDYAQVESLCEEVVAVPLPKWRAAANVGAALASRQPLQVRYYRSAAFQSTLSSMLARGAFDVLHATLIRMLPYVWNVRNPPVVVDLIDSLTLNLADRRSDMRGAKRLGYELEYRRVRDYERAVVKHFPALVVSSEADREVLGGDHIAVVPNGVDIDNFPFQGQEGRDAATLIFTGNMGYHPNEEAVLWFASEVWPLLRRDVPGVRFEVVGTNPGERLRTLATPGGGIEVLGRVPSVPDYLGRATVAVCPMRSGSGIQNKVLEALSMGTPVVASSIANRGVRAKADRDLLVADSPPDIADAVRRLLKEPSTRSELAASGRAFVEQNYRWEQHCSRLVEVYRGVAGEAGGY
jgi:sugar transferase (PEP-CTERM/EpsH1 system associated)